MDYACDNAQSCVSSADCPDGSLCQTNGCCPGNNCSQRGAVAVCPNPGFGVLRRGERGVGDGEVKWNLVGSGGQRAGVGV